MNDYLEGCAIGATIMFLVGVLLMACQPGSTVIKTDKVLPIPSRVAPPNPYSRVA